MLVSNDDLVGNYKRSDLQQSNIFSKYARKLFPLKVDTKYLFPHLRGKHYQLQPGYKGGDTNSW